MFLRPYFYIWLSFPLPLSPYGFQTRLFISADGRSARGYRCPIARHRGRRAVSDPPGRHRLRQNVHHRKRRGAGPQTHARFESQQDAGRPTLQRIQVLLPAERRRVLRFLLRLLSARGLPAHHRHVHREGYGHQSRNRQAPPARHGFAPLRASRRAGRLVRLLPLWHGRPAGLRRASRARGARHAHRPRQVAPPLRRRALRQ